VVFLCTKVINFVVDVSFEVVVIGFEVVVKRFEVVVKRFEVVVVKRFEVVVNLFDEVVACRTASLALFAFKFKPVNFFNSS
jgi:hypothetical protein